jgi:glycosyltransferase involved in cell wall biosynthesis
VRICIIGKYPPIQGGVSMRTYWSAHALAAHGHEVHVVTNAKEAAPPFRMHMRSEDWKRCEAVYGQGCVRVHWTDPVDRAQSYIPMASPFVSKLAGVAARVHAEHPFDVIYSHYLEPYGVAAYLAAQITGAPHVARMAGSDAGRLWHHPQLEPLYDHVLRSAACVIAAGAVTERAIQRGVDPDRIAFGGGFTVPEDLFTPDGPPLDLGLLRAEIEPEPDMRDLWWGEIAPDRPYFGVCGKLGDNKGSFALLAAMHRLALAGLDVGLVALAHGQPAVERHFRARATELGLADRVLQIPFLPHWRVPEFLRGCLAVCCLEQDFPIGFHSPIIPREVLLSGTCLVASTEMIRKLPAYERLPDGYGCVAVEDVNDADLLGERLAGIARDPQPAAAVGARGRAFACGLQRDISFPQRLEQVLEAAVTGRRGKLKPRGSVDQPEPEDGDSFPLTRLAAGEIGYWDLKGAVRPLPPIDRTRAGEILATLEQRLDSDHDRLKSLLAATRTEIAVADAESEATGAAPDQDPVFRLHSRRWAIDDGDIAALVPLRDPGIRLLAFDYDVTEFIGVRTAADLPPVPAPRPSFMVTFGAHRRTQQTPLVVDRATARILQLCDGTRTASEIVAQVRRELEASAGDDNLEWIEGLFVQGLLSLHERRPAAGLDRAPARAGQPREEPAERGSVTP